MRSISNLIKNQSNEEDYTDHIKIITSIEGGNVYNVRRLIKNHFSIQMRPDSPSIYRYPEHHSYWFYFKIEGVEDKEIRIDVTNCNWMRTHWKNYKPVYSFIEDPDSLENVVWHKIEKTKLAWNTFSFVQRFDRNVAWVALRYPYNYSRQKRYLESIRGNEHVTIEELGNTVLGNSLSMVIVTDKKVPSYKKKGVLVYAREHGIEQDGSWVTEGMIDFLLSSKLQADLLRRNLLFMIIPIISPDSAILGRTVDPVTGKSLGGEFAKDSLESVEAKLLYDRMKRFVDRGGSLDLCISFHNPHGTEPNLYPTYRPFKDMIRLERVRQLHKAILKNSEGYTTWKEFTDKGAHCSVGRFARDFGSSAVIYEVNHQAKGNYLSLERLKGMGEVFMKGIADYYGLRQ